MTPFWATAQVAGYRGPVSAHFDGNIFKNLDSIQTKTIKDVLRWRFSAQSARETWPSWIDSSPGPAPLSTIESNQVRYTVINHASVLIQTQNLNILTDPIWSDRASPVNWAGPKRVRAPGLSFETLPRIHAVLVSHNHYDHMDLPTLQRLEARDHPEFLVGLGNAAFLKRFGLTQVRDMDWWDTATVGSQKIHFVPARHFSRRGFTDGMKTLWGGFVLQGPAGTVFFAGDTGYGTHFAAIRKAFGPVDLSFLPIGAYAPRWFMGDIHLAPEQAVQAHQDLECRYSVGIHFGTFQLTDEGIDAPATELAAARQRSGLTEETFAVPLFGKAYDLSFRKNSSPKGEEFQ